MKKIICIVISIFIFILGACSSVVVNASNEQINPVKIWFQNQNGNKQTLVVINEDTGVNYIVVSIGCDRGGISITPRLNPDGSLYVNK